MQPRNLSWKSALYELVLIFIGINLAIWFNNWNEKRQLRNLEKETLIELINGVEKDLHDIDNNINSYTRRQESFKRLINHLEHDKSYTDSLSQDIERLAGYTFFVNNTAPYEVLKSHGFDLISDDSLRLSILDYYDIQQQGIAKSDALHHENATTYLKPILISHFSLSESNRFKPFDYTQLTENREVLQALHWSASLEQDILQRYQQIRSSGEELKKIMQKQVEHL